MTINSGDVITQIANIHVNWNVAIISIAVAVAGCWLLAECIHFRDDRRRMRQRLAQPN
jgi:hypothetical protein